MKIGITGSIACGKSTITEYLKKLGYSVIDADKIGHEVLKEVNIKRELINVFGEKILSKDEIDRKVLSTIVFNDKNNLKKLNSIVHPRIRELIVEYQRILEDKSIQFLDVALLFETKFENLVDKVIVVHTDLEQQLKRLIERNKLTKKQALLRINSQIASKDKKKLADYVVDNSGDIESSYRQIDDILLQIKKESS